VIAVAKAGFQYTDVTARTAGIACSQYVEELS
jgi:hypothetical protein